MSETPDQVNAKRCEHHWVFLRQLSEPDDKRFHSQEVNHFDIFFCRNCAEYKRQKVAETVTYGDGRKETRSLIR